MAAVSMKSFPPHSMGGENVRHRTLAAYASQFPVFPSQFTPALAFAPPCFVGI